MVTSKNLEQCRGCQWGLHIHPPSSCFPENEIRVFLEPQTCLFLIDILPRNWLPNLFDFNMLLLFKWHSVCILSLIWLHHTAKIVFTIMLKVNGGFDTSIFSRGVNSFTSVKWLKERRIFNQNVFLVHVQTLLEVNKIFVQFHRLSSYQNDLYWNDWFHAKQLALLKPSKKHFFLWAWSLVYNPLFSIYHLWRFFFHIFYIFTSWTGGKSFLGNWVVKQQTHPYGWWKEQKKWPAKHTLFFCLFRWLYIGKGKRANKF